MQMDRTKLADESISLHEHGGKLEVKSKVQLKNKHDLSIAYTPGVAAVSMLIKEHPEKVFTHTLKKNTVAVVSDGSAVLGLGNIGAKGAIPVMEGKAVLFKEFANVDSFPICIETQDVEKIIEIVKNIAPVFGGVNLEDISAPRCFEIEERLQELGIPVFHDDQHGTAVVVLAGLINALKVTGKSFWNIKVVISGAGAAGTTVAKLLIEGDFSNKIEPVYDLILCDSKGILHKDRELNAAKKEIAEKSNKRGIKGSLADALKGADVFIGLSAPGIVTKEMIASMNHNAIVFAMANPVPEIMPEIAIEAGAAIVATGRSDYPNQINNVLAFPGIFRGALDAKATKINKEMKVAAALALANLVSHPSPEHIVPNALEPGVAAAVADAVAKKAIYTNVTRK